MEDSRNFECWRARDKLLKRDDTPSWKAAALRRGNMSQLFHEWMSKDMEYDMFDYLFDKELKDYEKVRDGEDQRKQLQDAVETIVPDIQENIGKFKSSLTYEKLLQIDSVKTALEHCKFFDEMDEEEDKLMEKVIISLKEDPPPPVESPKKTNSSKLPIQKDAGPKESSIYRTVDAGLHNIPESSRKTVSRNPFETSSGHRPKQFSIYETVEGASSERSDYPRQQKKNFFEETLKKKRKYDPPPEDSDDSEAMEIEPEKKFHFKSAREQYEIDKKKNRNRSPQGTYGSTSSTTVKKSLGARPRNTCYGKFVPPSIKDQKETNEREKARPRKQNVVNTGDDDSDLDPRLKSIEPKIIELVTNEIMDHGPPVQWDDIAGLEFAKSTIKEIVIWPMLRPDIFTGLRGPPKGILLFGPPGTGKTLIGKCIASQSGATFFSISASSLTSKWVGEGEKMVRALFAVASCHQPAVIFIDEIDSLLSQRCDSEHESSRRIKTEFLVQLDGAATSSDERILVVGATNRPQEIDEAARRRLSKRLYIPLPEPDARKQIVESLLQQQSCKLSDEEISKIVSETDGYSGADMANLCREAALGPIRSLQGMDISAISKEDVRPIILEDFQKALLRVRPSVSTKDLDLFVEWNKQFGCCAL